MKASHVTPPTFLPRLSPGRHRNPKRGACLMEYASFLAGERWSDHPACTHPVLAAIARGVNDLSSADARDSLLSVVPRLIGVTSEDPRLSLRLALLAAVEALPVASMERQRALAVGIRHCLEALNRTGGTDEGLTERAEHAFALVPDAAAWSARFCESVGQGWGKPAAASEAIAGLAVRGIADACVSDNDARLRTLLDDTVAEGERFVAQERRRQQGLAA
ncbi:hypothetical protein [Naasia aerilata]|uniref:HEAT repeat domain-containing protein n=1 Tax=Naasia aerilata TaxID=1162966 RepID=A0ABN6XND8_9MICO|nr:hypothetical protein [Naasia aerilata]BDZ46504.1 hypothetical protein GCM10025866_24130 [Naasia aerilata]